MADAPLIWAADISKTRSGFAFGRAGEQPTTVSIVGRDDDGPRAQARLWVYMRDLLKVAKPDYFFAEALLDFGAFQPQIDWAAQTVKSARGPHASFELMRMFSTAELFAELASIVFRKVHVATIRTEFLGDGRLKRKVAKARARAMVKLLGWTAANDDEADACAVWHYATCVTAPRLAVPIHPGMFAKAATLAEGGRAAAAADDLVAL